MEQLSNLVTYLRSGASAQMAPPMHHCSLYLHCSRWNSNATILYTLLAFVLSYKNRARKLTFYFFDSLDEWVLSLRQFMLPIHLKLSAICPTLANLSGTCECWNLAPILKLSSYQPQAVVNIAEMNSICQNTSPVAIQMKSHFRIKNVEIRFAKE